MWCEFGQQDNKTQVWEFVEPQPFYDFLESNQYAIWYASALSEETVEVHYKQKEHCETLSPNINILVALAICWAHLRLCKALEILGERVLFFQLDSMFFTHCPGQPSPLLRSYLGDFKDKIKNGDATLEFC